MISASPGQIRTYAYFISKKYYVILGQDDEFPQIITCAESVLTHWWQLLHSNPTYNLNSNPLTYNTNHF